MNYYDEIKQELINNEIYKKAKDYSKNKNDLKTCYNVGKILSEAGKHYGEGIIKDYSKKLTNELGKGYTQTRLKYYRRFFNVFSKGPTLSDELSYSHYCEIIWLSNIEIDYYMMVAINNKLSVRELREKVKNKEYKRLTKKAKEDICTGSDNKIEDHIKNPIIIKNNNDYEKISEKILQQMILEDIPSFLNELGEGFTFIKNEYKIKIGDNYNYIDLLLFNYIYNCFVIVELKVTDLKKEHIGQVQVYMNYIDKHLKNDNQNKTIGIIIVRKDNKNIIEYSSDNRIISREYQVI